MSFQPNYASLHHQIQPQWEGNFTSCDETSCTRVMWERSFIKSHVLC